MGEVVEKEGAQTVNSVWHRTFQTHLPLAPCRMLPTRTAVRPSTLLLLFPHTTGTNAMEPDSLVPANAVMRRKTARQVGISLNEWHRSLTGVILTLVDSDTTRCHHLNGRGGRSHR